MGAKKIGRGKYEHRGYVLYNCGYFPPEHCVYWEAADPETECAEFHAPTKRRLMQMIDADLDQGNRKDEDGKFKHSD